MNYSSGIKKRKIFKRLLISWVIVAAVAFLIGGIAGWLLARNHYTKPARPVTQIYMYSEYNRTTTDTGTADEYHGDLYIVDYDTTEGGEK